MKPQAIPYDFIFDHLDPERCEIKRMFGHSCLYYDGIMSLFFIMKEGDPDSGVCIATAAEHIPSLRKELPSLRSLTAFGESATGWQLIPAIDPRFESDVERACALIVAKDERIGREPGRKKKSSAKPAPKVAAKAASASSAKKKPVASKYTRRRPLMV